MNSLVAYCQVYKPNQRVITDLGHVIGMGFECVGGEFNVSGRTRACGSCRGASRGDGDDGEALGMMSIDKRQAIMGPVRSESHEQISDREMLRWSSQDY